MLLHVAACLLAIVIPGTGLEARDVTLLVTLVSPDTDVSNNLGNAAIPSSV
jgi:hypothetical protein